MKTTPKISIVSHLILKFNLLNRLIARSLPKRKSYNANGKMIAVKMNDITFIIGNTTDKLFILKSTSLIHSINWSC